MMRVRTERILNNALVWKKIALERTDALVNLEAKLERAEKRAEAAEAKLEKVQEWRNCWVSHVPPDGKNACRAYHGVGESFKTLDAILDYKAEVVSLFK